MRMTWSIVRTSLGVTVPSLWWDPNRRPAQTTEMLLVGAPFRGRTTPIVGDVDSSGIAGMIDTAISLRTALGQRPWFRSVFSTV